MPLNRSIEKLAHDVIGAAIEVHRQLGPGFLESVYEEALSAELDIRGISFQRQYEVTVRYKDHDIGKGRIDYMIDDQLVVELKAVQALAPVHIAQAISYLKMTELPLALLINFNVPVLKDGIKRVVLD